MVTVNGRITKKEHVQVTAISAIIKRLENYKDLPFIEKLPFVVDFILDNQFKENIQKIYLFGSYAYGTPHSKSDLDICVIVDDTVMDKRKEIYCTIELRIYKEKIIPSDLLICGASAFNEKKDIQKIERVVFLYGELIYARNY